MHGRYWIIVLAALVTLSAGIWVYRIELDERRSSTSNTFEVRASLLREYIQLMRQNVYVLERTIEERYAELERNDAFVPEIQAIRHYPDYGVWGISGLASENGLPGLSGTLTGFDTLNDPSTSTKRELSAVLGADYQFGTLIEQVPEIIWVYYTSKRDFIYIGPDPAIADFRFSEVLREKEFWAQAIPEVNPKHEQIISDLYRDAYGQGLMISISSPVLIGGAFRGVASLDLGIDLLQELTRVGKAPGESILVDENEQIVARAQSFNLNETYTVDGADGWVRQDDAQWLTAGIVEGELRLLHRLPHDTLYWGAARASALIWIVLGAMFVLVVFSVRLNSALATVRTLMNHDALTELLNRRGFSDAAEATRAKTEKEGRGVALLVIDIDYFKSVNDQQGHEVGDEVLWSLARRLSASLHESDLLCRWGGEELVALIVYDDASTLPGIAERIRTTVEGQPFGDKALHLTISGGLTVWHGNEALQAAVDRADQLLYRAKAAGRNRIEKDAHIEAAMS